MTYQDFEVIGLDSDGTVVQWNAETNQPYNCGETLEEFGVDNLTSAELQRVKETP